MPADRKYESKMVDQARMLCRHGLVDDQLAEFFGVSRSTLNRWKDAYPEFKQAVTEGKDVADAQIADALFRRAKGYRHIAYKLFQHEGRVIAKRYVEHYPPDTTACIFWLKNRRPDIWRDAWRAEITGKDGQPIQFENATALEDARAVAFAMAQGAAIVEKAQKTGNAAAKKGAKT